MKIRGVTFVGVRGVRDVTLDFAASSGTGSHDLVVVTGRAASGKTRFLEALVAAKEAIGAYGPMQPGEDFILPGAEAAKVQIAFQLDEEERVFAGTTNHVVEAEASFQLERIRGHADEGLSAVLSRYTHAANRGKVEYFPSNRRLPNFGPFAGLSPAEQRMHRAGKEYRKYSFVVRFLASLQYDEGRANEFAARLQTLSPTVRYQHGVAYEGLPRCLVSHDGPRVSHDELSDSEQDAVLFAAAAQALGLGRSILLIDRPELWLDRSQIKSFMSGLRNLGENNQLIVASSSPEVAATEGAHVVSLDVT